MATMIPLKKTGRDDMKKSTRSENLSNNGRRKERMTITIYTNVIIIEMAIRDRVIFNLDVTS